MEKNIHSGNKNMIVEKYRVKKNNIEIVKKIYRQKKKQRMEKN